MIKRWDAIMELHDGERITLILRGDTKKEAIDSAIGDKGYKGVKKIISVEERIVEKTFPEPPKKNKINFTELMHTPKHGKKVFHT